MTSGPEEVETSFADLGIAEPIRRSLAEVGYETPTPIQAATIPAMLSGRHLVGLAQTGTGKTAAFALPLLTRLTVEDRTTQALILTPTRELALQVADAIGRYGHHLPGLQVLPIYGGQGYPVQLAGLRRGAQVVVGTPGRVIDHLTKGTLDLSRLSVLVLDEADEMLRMGFQSDVEAILAATPPSRQVALFSATMPSAIRRIAQRYLTDPVQVAVRARTVTASNTRQRYLLVPNARKLDALTRILEVEPFEAMIVFVRTKQATEELAERLRARGFPAAAINGDLVQAQRERLIGQLRTGALDLLVATDVAARGLDVERISHVLNYDIPTDPEAYVHRIGRTGRAGRSGEAVLFVTPRERHLLTAIERATRQPLTEMSLPSVEDVNATRKVRFAESITEQLGAVELPLFRQLVSDYAAEHEVPMADIAAALAVLARDDSAEFLLEPDPPATTRDSRPRQDSRQDSRRDAPRDRLREHHRSRDAHDKPPARVAGARGGSRPNGDPRSSGDMALYRIGVGRRHHVKPSSIVGAIANEGGLTRQDFGHIDIQLDHSLVELPAELSNATLAALRDTRISGKRIDLTRQSGGRPKRRS